jgi:hypothetical protein
MSAHEQGYRAFKQYGLSARNPYERQERLSAQWARGFEKAKRETDQ